MAKTFTAGVHEKYGKNVKKELGARGDNATKKWTQS
jgi:hypothetical protein